MAVWRLWMWSPFKAPKNAGRLSDTLLSHIRLRTDWTHFVRRWLSVRDMHVWALLLY